MCPRRRGSSSRTFRHESHPRAKAYDRMNAVLTVFEIYESIQGESTHAGRPCVFIRLAACDLRCVWCDTPYAFTGGRKMSEDEVASEVQKSGPRLVELTGGEPLLQPAAI